MDSSLRYGRLGFYIDAEKQLNKFDLACDCVTNKAKALHLVCFFRFAVIPYAHRPIFKMQSHFELGSHF